MFESASIRRSPLVNRKRELLKKGISLVISIVAHAVALILLVTYYTPLKILDFSGNVRDVFIAPPVERLFLPEEGPGLMQEAGTRRPRVSDPAAPSAKEGAVPEAAPRTDPAGPVRPEPLPEASGWGEDFRLSPPPPSATEPDARDSFQLVPERSRRSYSYAQPAAPALKPGTLSRYNLPPSPLADPLTSRISPDRTPKGYLSFPNKPEAPRADISGWADRAVALILDNWWIPLQLLDQDLDEFEILVTVQKDGWIASTEVVRAARVRPLQAAALKALELSSPLPRLPRTFPEKNLEILLVFGRR